MLLWIESISKSHKKFSEWKQLHVEMEPSKTNQTRWEWHHNTFKPSLHLGNHALSTPTKSTFHKINCNMITGVSKSLLKWCHKVHTLFVTTQLAAKLEAIKNFKGISQLLHWLPSLVPRARGWGYWLPSYWYGSVCSNTASSLAEYLASVTEQ